MFGLMLQDQDRQILTLQLILQRERENSKEMKRKLENLKAKNFLLRTQKIELSNKVAETQAAAYQLQNKMEASLEEKQNQIKGLADKEEELMRANLRVAEINELVKQKEAEVEEMKQQPEKPRATENNTIPQYGTAENQENSSEGREASESKSEQNEDTAKEGEWVKVQTNVDDEPLKDGSEEASNDHHNDNPANSQKNENMSEVKEQSEKLKIGEGKLDSKEEKEHGADKTGEIEMSQESTMEVKEQSTEPTNDQETSDNQEKKDSVVAQYGEENFQSGNRNKVTPKEPTKDAQGKGHKVRRNKNRGKGRRQRKATSSIKEDNRYVTKENNKGEGENHESAQDTTKTEIPDGSQIDGSLNSKGQRNSEAAEETTEEKTVASNQQLENAQNQGDGEGGSEVQGDGINRTVEGEDKKITSTKDQSEKTENPQTDKAKNENSDDKTEAAPNLDTESVDNAEKQDGIVMEEADVTNQSVPQQTDADNVAAGDEGTKVQGHSTDHNVGREEKEIASKDEQSGMFKNLKEDEAKNENNNNETGASAEADSNIEKQTDAEKQDAIVKEETDVNTTSITEQQGDVNTESVTKKPDADNADDEHQTKVSENTTNTDDGSSIDETKDQENMA